MQQVNSRTTFLHAFALVLGFTTVFTILGASVGLLGYALYDILPAVTRVGAILLIVFALRVMNVKMSYLGWAALAILLAGVTYWLDRFQFDQTARVVNAVIIGLTVLSGAGWDRLVLLVLALILGGLSWLTSGSAALWLRVTETVLVVLIIYFGNRTDLFEREMRMDMGGRFGSNATYWRSFLVGMIFAAGWTPCVGPILAGILLLASQTQTVAQGAVLLLVYSLGLGIPFLIAGALFSRLTAYMPRFYKHLGKISLISGLLLLVIAILIYTDSLARLAQFGTFLNIEQGLASGSGTEISLAIAFAAGFVSFLSPCVLPLVPAYLGYLSGVAIGSAGSGSSSTNQPVTA